MTEARLEAFVRGVAFRETDAAVDAIVGVVRAVVYKIGADWSDLKISDRALVKIAALALAFYREIRDVLGEKFVLDFRERAILDAVVEHLSKRSDGS